MKNQTQKLSLDNKGLLAYKFLKEVAGQELFPPIHNVTPLVEVSGWNQKQYFTKYYKTNKVFPLFLTSKEGEGIMYIPAGNIKHLAEEVFKEYWRNPKKLDARKKDFEKQAQIINKIYNQCSCAYTNKASLKLLLKHIEEVKEATWSLNTILFFSIYFDKEMCNQLLADLGTKFNSQELERIWERASIPVQESFVTRRLLYILNLIINKTPWSEIIEKCQFFAATYQNIANTKETEKSVEKNYGKYRKINIARKELENQASIKNKTIIEYNNWLSTLKNNEEKKLANYLQEIINLRDIRKDYISKMLVVVYRVAQRFFKDAKIPEKYIHYCTLGELKNGARYLMKYNDVFEQRVKGFSVFVPYDGEMEFEYNMADENREIIEQFFTKQTRHKDDGQDETIKGQAGSLGKIKGIAKIIKNLKVEGKKLKKGDILVTGMTRPEFVPLMKIASAIITDEGGITCHAAIISRELNKPCVIGTKVATQILKDGDLVEVDANKGIVKIIKKVK